MKLRSELAGQKIMTDNRRRDIKRQQAKKAQRRHDLRQRIYGK